MQLVFFQNGRLESKFNLESKYKLSNSSYGDVVHIFIYVTYIHCFIEKTFCFIKCGLIFNRISINNYEKKLYSIRYSKASNGTHK